MATKATKAKPHTSLESKLKEAQIRKANAEALVAEFEAAEKAREDADHRASANQAKVYPFMGAVSAGSVQPCIATLGSWSRREPGCDITIVFNSPGGNVIDGLALYDFIDELKANGHKITTVARGMAASMGGILLQAGDERIIGANAHILIHEITTAMIGKFSEIEDEVAFCKMLQERLLNILAERSTLTAKQIRTRWLRTDWWIGSEEAVALGFADEIG
jgi:ATP-dependent Clp endopeptidase proteolytic subunit ClpP